MLTSLISKIISRIKKEPFVLDKRIPASYLLCMIMGKALALLRGCYQFRRLGHCFVGYETSIKCTSKISTAGTIVVGDCCYIDALSTDGLSFGRNVSIGRCTTIACTGTLKSLGKGLVVGNNVGMGSHGFWGCAGGIEIGDDTIIGNYVSAHSENHIFTNLSLPIRMQGVTHKGIKIGKNCWIGAKVTFLDGSEIGEGCVVAAGAVVRGSFPANTVIGGVPAKVLKNRLYDETLGLFSPVQ